MRLRNLALAALAGMALLGVGVSSAQATAHWNVLGAELSGSETVSYSGGPWTLSTTVLGVAVEVTASGVACSSGCTISGTGESAATLKFTGVKVVKPTNCTVAGETFTTKALKDQVIMDPKKESLRVFDKYTPASGTTLFEVEFAGAKCSLAELAIPFAGSLGGEFPEETGVVATEQKLTFGSAQQTTSETALTASGKSATLAGEAKLALTGGKAGAKWGPMEALWLSRSNVSGAGEAAEGGFGTCEFTVVGQKCKIKFGNISGRGVEVVKTEFNPAGAARYSRVGGTCTVAAVMGVGGECTDKVEVTAIPGGHFFDSYCLEVAGVINPAERSYTCATLSQ